MNVGESLHAPICPLGDRVDRHQFCSDLELIAVTPIDILYVVEGYSYRQSIRGSMEQNQTNLLQRTLDLLILKALGDGKFHGLGISHRIEQITKAHFRSNPDRFSQPLIAWKRPVANVALGRVRE